MTEWREATLGEIAEIEMGQSPSGETCNTIGNGIALLNGPTEFGIKNPTPVQYTTDSKRECKPLDVLFCVRGSTTGRMNWADKIYSIGRGIATIRHKEGNEYRYFLKGIIDYNLDLLLSSATGSTFPNVTRSQIEGIEINLPPLPEQRAIASILSSLDDKIDLLHRQNKTLEEMAETLFRQWFVEEADEGWEKVTLKSLCKKLTKGTTPTSLKRKFVEVGINFIKVNCIDDNGNFLYDKFNFIDDETHNIALKRSILKEGDLLYSIAGTIGRVIEVTKEVLPANVNQALAILRVDNDIINPYYIKYSLRDPNVTFELHSKVIHAVQPNLSLSEIGSTVIPMPDPVSRNKFNEVINPIENKIKNNQTQIRTLTQLRDSLLPKLMKGEVRVNSIEKQPYT